MTTDALEIPVNRQGVDEQLNREDWEQQSRCEAWCDPGRYPNQNHAHDQCQRYLRCDGVDQDSASVGPRPTEISHSEHCQPGGHQADISHDAVTERVGTEVT